jgi:hypothetical protein
MNGLLWLLIFTVFIFASSNKASSQTVSEKTAQTSLEGLTEPILVNGQPALRISSQKSGTTEVRYQKRDSEDSLVFSVRRLKAFLQSLIPAETGTLYVTKTRIVYDPDENKKTFRNIARTDIKESSVDGTGMGGGAFNFVKIQTKNDGLKLLVLSNQELGFFNRKDTRPQLDFLLLAVGDFDSAVVTFNKLTASVRQNEEEDVEEETTADVNDKYDRFKDVTIINTSKMLVRGTKRSIRTYAEYSFAGKTQKTPEKVTLYFYASAARPLFREDDLELNFLVDDKRIPLGQLRLADEEKTKTATKQTVSISLPYETFAQIANAKKVEFQIGTLEYKLTVVHLEAFRKLLTYKIEE